MKWHRVNFHSHMKCPHYNLVDDGDLPPAEDFARYEKLGFDHNVHSVHALTHQDYESADAEWQKLRRHDAELLLNIHRSLGCEVEVARGPNYNYNCNHLGAVGLSRLVPSGLPLKTSLDWIHSLGGIAIVNHPGPPHRLHWEPGYFTGPEVKDRIDAVEVYNGNSMLARIPFEETFEQAVSKHAMRVAAVTGCDTHGRKYELRIEATYVLSNSPEIRDILEAVRSCRTIATYGFPDLNPACPHLGRVLREREFTHTLVLGRSVASIELWENGVRRREWARTDRASERITVESPAVFVWHFRDGYRRGTTSPTWVDPGPAEPLPDLIVEVQPVPAVRNGGDAPSGPFRVTAGDRTFEMKSLAPGERISLDSGLHGRILIDADGIRERNERNNSAFLDP